MTTKSNKQITLNVSPDTVELINHLKHEFGVTTNSAVLKRALALSRIAAQSQDPETHTVRIVDSKNNQREIVLNG